MPDLTYAIKVWVDEVARSTVVDPDAPPAPSLTKRRGPEATRLSQPSQANSGSTPVTETSWREAISVTETQVSLPSRPTTSIFSEKTGSRARARSHIKNRADLRFARIEMRDLRKRETLPKLPESARELLKRLGAVNRGEGIIPSIIREEFQAAGGEFGPSNLITTSYHLTKDEALRELQGIVDIVDNAASCSDESQSEAAWNALVHCRVFEWALANSAGKSVKSWLVSSARMVPGVASKVGNPGNSGGAGSKMVDFCLTIEPTNPEQVTDIMEYQQASQLQTLNQSMYPPLRFRPVAIAVETNVDTSQETGETQLGIWTKAWFNRIYMLLQSRDALSSCPPLPLISIRGNHWFVLIAYLEEEGKNTDASHLQQLDEQSQGGEGLPKLVLAGQRDIGNTNSIYNTYQLLKSIRLLVDWAESDFRNYIDQVVMPIAMNVWVPQ
ncbi:hypothetical protein F4825DRAFT_248100 [Nemania diffusa]|nr:hypothetical protein F4825DRAFT_248100 [Nemania diffusa]